MARRTLDELLARAEARVERLEPVAAQAAVAGGALLIDIRGDGDRERDGVVPGSLHIPRTVLEWRLDPDSPFRNPRACDLSRRVLLICDHGCSASVASVGRKLSVTPDASDPGRSALPTSAWARTYQTPTLRKGNDKPPNTQTNAKMKSRKRPRGSGFWGSLAELKQRLCLCAAAAARAFWC